MPTVDETGRWDFPGEAAKASRRPSTRLELARDAARHAHEEYRLCARDVTEAARLARAAIGTPEATELFDRVKAISAVSRSVYRRWRQAQRAFERERRIVRRSAGFGT